jgi:ketosteroid isomerase-like protein
MAVGKPAIRVLWTSMTALPGMALSGGPMRAEVARSGDLGYVIGTYTMITNDAAGRAVNDHGKYVVVWKKQPDGNWKAVADIFNSDLPPGGVPQTTSSAQPIQPPPR